MKNMLSYIWPKGNTAIKRRVVLAMSLLVGAKLLNISVPFMFKYAVDELSAENITKTATTFIFALVIGQTWLETGKKFSRNLFFKIKSFLFFHYLSCSRSECRSVKIVLGL